MRLTENKVGNTPGGCFFVVVVVVVLFFLKNFTKCFRANTLRLSEYLEKWKLYT